VRLSKRGWASEAPGRALPEGVIEAVDKMEEIFLGLTPIRPYSVAA